MSKYPDKRKGTVVRGCLSWISDRRHHRGVMEQGLIKDGGHDGSIVDNTQREGLIKDGGRVKSRTDVNWINNRYRTPGKTSSPHLPVISGRLKDEAPLSTRRTFGRDFGLPCRIPGRLPSSIKGGASAVDKAEQREEGEKKNMSNREWQESS